MFLFSVNGITGAHQKSEFHLWYLLLSLYIEAVNRSYLFLHHHIFQIYSLTSHDHMIIGKPVILNLDYSNSILTGLFALLLLHLCIFSTLQWVPSFLDANLITLPLSLKYFSCLCFILQSKISVSAYKILHDLALFPLTPNLVPLPLLVSSLWSSDSQSVVRRPAQDLWDTFRESMGQLSSW